MQKKSQNFYVLTFALSQKKVQLTVYFGINCFNFSAS